MVFEQRVSSNFDDPWGSDNNSKEPKKNNDWQKKPKVNEFEEVLSKIQNFKGFSKSGKGGDGNNQGFGIKSLLLLLLVPFVLWVFSGFFVVQADEQGVVLRFGKYHRVVDPGLNYKMPNPVETLYKVSVTTINKEEIGYRNVNNNRGNLASLSRSSRSKNYDNESLMLTGDENIVDIDFEVQWRIKNAQDYLFNFRDDFSGNTVKNAAESAMREVVGKSPIAPVLSEGRSKIEVEAKELLQSILDSYESGIQITRLQMLKVDPPEKVINSFRDVQTARADQQRRVNQAESYKNDILPKARGEAAMIIEQANSYRSKIVNEAQGKTSRFIAVYDEYIKAPTITKQRLKLELMSYMFSKSDLIIMDPDSGQGVVPYLPLDSIKKTR